MTCPPKAADMPHKYCESRFEDPMSIMSITAILAISNILALWRTKVLSRSLTRAAPPVRWYGLDEDKRDCTRRAADEFAKTFPEPFCPPPRRMGWQSPAGTVER